MADKLPNDFPAASANGVSVIPRIQIPGLHINDALVDGEILIQWTPATSIMRPQTSTVFIVAGPNARRPGVQPHAGRTNPHHQALTETQAEGFIAIENNADGVTEQLAAASAQSPTKQTKKPGPKPGFKRRKSVAFTATSDIDASPTAPSPRKRGKKVPATDERGDEQVIVPTLDPSTMPQIAPIPTEDSPTAIETGNDPGSVKTSADDNMNGDIDEHVEDGVVEPAKAAAAERLRRLPPRALRGSRLRTE